MEEQLIEIRIDEQTESARFNREAPFAEIIRHAHQLASSPGRSITGVAINGDDITGRDWGEYSHLKALDLKQIEIKTGEIASLTRDMMQSQSEFLTSLTTEFETSAGKLRQGETVDGNESLGRALDGIQVVSYTTSMIERNLEFDTREGEYKGQTITDSLKRIEPILEDMMTSQSQEDWILLADLIEYELIPYLNDRIAILKLWQERFDA